MSSPASPSFHINEGGLMDHIGLNRYFAAKGVIDMAHEASEGSMQFAQDMWNENPNSFQNAGHRATSFASAGLLTSLSVIWAGKHKAVTGKNFVSDVFHKNGSTYGLTAGKAGAEVSTLEWLGGRAGSTLTGAKAAAFTKGAEKGFFKMGAKGAAGKFIKRGFWRGPMGMVTAFGAGMALEAVAAPVVGFMGKLADEAFQGYQNAKRIQYDNRYFNTGQWQQNAYQQMGGAINNYENNMTSIARIYHGR
jgi:hypothetical protein